MYVNKLFIAMCLCLTAQSMSAQQLTRLQQGFRIDNGQAHVRVQFLTDKIVRIEKSPNGEYKEPQSLVVTLKPQTVKTAVAESGNSVTVSSLSLAVTVDKRTGQAEISESQSRRSLLKELSCSFSMRVAGPDKGAYVAEQTFTLEPDEAIYGLGILQEPKLSKRGTSRHMVQSNTEDFVPVVQSVKGWGLYWDNTSPTDFSDNDKGMTFRSEVAEAVDYYFMFGGSVDGVNACMRQLSGAVPMPPKWTYGFWQSKERYKSWGEVQAVVDNYRRLRIPLDCVVQDWQYWGTHYLWNAMEFLTNNYANPQSNIDSLHAKHAKLLITIWSSFGPQTKQYREMQPKGMLFNTIETWPQSGLADFWPPCMDYPSGVRPYDVYNKEARAIYWKHLTRLYNLGVDAWWMDSTEPDHINATDSDFDMATAMGSWRKVRNVYPLMAVEGVYRNQRAHAEKHDTATSRKRVMIMTRSVFAGQQRTGANTWSGDVGSSWNTLRCQIPAALNFSMTGNPNFNSDIGGFFAGAYNKGYLDDSACRNPLYQELYVRWMQFGLFNPIMRSHGTEVSRELYKYGKEGEPVYDALVSAVRMRYTLIPYIYSTAHDVTANSGSYMRALVSDFKEDRRTWNIADEFMFGRSLLVAPIVKAQYTPEKTVAVDPMSGWNREAGYKDDTLKIEPWTTVKQTSVYLPKGAGWYDYWTGARSKGGETLTLSATLSTIPLFVRAGSILPVGEVMQYVDEKPADNLEIRVYPGADADFTLYEDEGDSYDYERGQFATISFHWDDKTRTLTIGKRNGQYKGMIMQRKFNIKAADNSVAKTVNYNGAKVKVKL